MSIATLAGRVEVKWRAGFRDGPVGGARSRPAMRRGVDHLGPRLPSSRHSTTVACLGRADQQMPATAEGRTV